MMTMPSTPYADGLAYGGKRCQGTTRRGQTCLRWTRVEYSWWGGKTLALCAVHAPENWLG